MAYEQIYVSQFKDTVARAIDNDFQSDQQLHSATVTYGPIIFQYSQARDPVRPHTDYRDHSQERWSASTEITFEQYRGRIAVVGLGIHPNILFRRLHVGYGGRSPRVESQRKLTADADLGAAVMWARSPHLSMKHLLHLASFGDGEEDYVANELAFIRSRGNLARSRTTRPTFL